ncbi:hypothetical protein FKP32DRAFT_1680518 [Trametes sanguinea]|nr:hypothetical protein FKP32DRAFT_1680518 [Trametes sanguinea]
MSVTDYLLQDAKSIVRSTVADVELLFQTMRDLNVFIGGLSMLPYFLRDLHYNTSFPLQFFVPAASFTIFIRHLRHQHHARLRYKSTPPTNYHGFRKLVGLQGTRRDIIVFSSANECALSPLVRSPSTSAMCYVGATRFGVLWPSLTFARRAMLGEFPPSSSKKSSIADDLGVDNKLYSWMWSDLNDPVQLCSRLSFRCPAQTRHLLDDGTLRGTWLPLQPIPAMPNIYFRLDERPCGGPCLQPSSLLPHASDRIRVIPNDTDQ